MIIRGDSIAECWLKALIKVTEGNSRELSPVIVSFQTNIPPPSYKEKLENDLNCYLQSINKATIDTIASTIFPKSLSSNPKMIYDRFNKIWPNIKKYPQNKNGNYFRRLTAYGEKDGKPFNQLQHITDAYNGNDVRKPVHRRSALIALTFDPMKDHTFQRQRGFPCLQQVCFVPESKGKKLTLTAIYAMQYLGERAYGNYLGLQNLGNFMAEEMGLKLDKINCISSVLSLAMKKTDAQEIINKYKNVL